MHIVVCSTIKWMKKSSTKATAITGMPKYIPQRWMYAMLQEMHEILVNSLSTNSRVSALSPLRIQRGSPTNYELLNT